MRTLVFFVRALVTSSRPSGILAFRRTKYSGSGAINLDIEVDGPAWPR